MANAQLVKKKKCMLHFSTDQTVQICKILYFGYSFTDSLIKTYRTFPMNIET